MSRIIAYFDDGLRFIRRKQIKYSIPQEKFFDDPEGWEEWVDKIMEELYGKDGLGKDPVQLRIEEALKLELEGRRNHNE